MLPGAKLQIPDPLPCSHRQFPVRDWDGDATAYEGGFDVCLSRQSYQYMIMKT